MMISQQVVSHSNDKPGECAAPAEGMSGQGLGRGEGKGSGRGWLREGSRERVGGRSLCVAHARSCQRETARKTKRKRERERERGRAKQEIGHRAAGTVVVR